jgi:hypothetical protein
VHRGLLGDVEQREGQELMEGEIGHDTAH